MNHSATVILCAGVFLASMSFGEEIPRACKAVDQLVQAPGCRVTECRLGGLSTVLLGSEDGPRFETRGDLLLLDRECDSKSTIPSLFSSYRQALEGSGFELKSPARMQTNFGSMVFQKQGQWIELTALLLEGAPTVSMRSVRTDGSTAKVRVLEVPATVTTPAVPESAAPAGSVLAKPEPKPASEVIATATTSGEPASKPRIVKRTDAIAPTGFNPDAALGPVSVEVMVDEKGAIARILSTKGNPALLSPALQAIRNWSFEPAIAAGQPAPGVLLLEVAFQARR